MTITREKIETTYRYDLKDIQGTIHTLFIATSYILDETNIQDMIQYLIWNTIIMDYDLDTNTLDIRVLSESRAIIHLNYNIEQEKLYINLLRSLFLLKGTKHIETKSKRRLMSEYFPVVYSLIFNVFTKQDKFYTKFIPKQLELAEYKTHRDNTETM